MVVVEEVGGTLGVDISPSKDGGVIKTILREGVGEDTPCDGCTVYVHYTAMFENRDKFDCSRDRGEPFDFKLGEENIIPGWDIGIKSMKLYEKCELVISPEYAYGDEGFPPKMIRPGTTLIFEVEIVRWADDDITERKDSGVLKRMLEEGVEGGKPNLEGSVKVYLRGTHEGKVFDEREVEFIVGDGYEQNIVDGIEEGVLTMTKNEKATFLISSQYGFKQAGNETFGIPGNADKIKYEIHLLDFENTKEIHEMSYSEKLEKAEQLKERGSKCFKGELYEKAIKYYDRILMYVDIDQQNSDYSLSLPFKIAANSNAAMCLLKLGECTQAKLRAERVLLYDPDNVKGHYRLGESYLHMKDFEKAVAAYKKVLQIEPENSAAKRQLATSFTLMKKAKQKEKDTYNGIFSKLSDMTSDECPLATGPSLARPAEGGCCGKCIK